MRILFVLLVVITLLFITFGYDLIKKLFIKQNKSKMDQIKKEWDDLIEQRKKMEEIEKQILDQKK